MLKRIVLALSICLAWGLSSPSLPLLSQVAHAAPCDVPVTNPIACENSLPGTPESVWQVGGGTGDGDITLQGFASPFSVNAGTTVPFKIKTDAKAYSITIYRIGYYQGNGAREIATVTPSAPLPQTQPACITNATTHEVDCGNWAVSASWAIPSTAVSGVYIALLTRTDTGGQSTIYFVVRNDASTAPMVYQTADETWQAYNDYGGYNFYTSTEAYKVSYNRPFHTCTYEEQTCVWNAEYPMIRWMEANGYNVTYLAGVDAESKGSLLTNHKVFVTAGHDEYWSGNQRANVEAARNAGVNLAFFSGNDLFWKTRWENSIDGSNTPYRTLVTYKETKNGPIDPADPPTWTGTWADPRYSPPADGGRPQNALTGTEFTVNDETGDGIQGRALQVPAIDGKMNFWRNTAVASNAAAGKASTITAGTCNCIVGYEWNSDLDNGARPAGLFDLSSSTYSTNQLLLDYGSTYGSGTATHSLTLYRASNKALVFSAGSVQYSYGLDSDTSFGTNVATDSSIQQATVNLFADMGVQPGSLQSGQPDCTSCVVATASTDTTPPTSSVTPPASGTTFQVGTPVTITGTATDSGGGVVAGVEVSVDGGATWHPATGHESWSYSWTPSTSGSVTIESRPVDDSGNLGAPSAGVVVTVAASSCPCSLWSSLTSPASIATNDTSAVEVGVKFTADTNGWVSGIRFYKGAGNTGTHMGDLWSSTGTLLASATFTGETASGWQQVSFSSPVAVTANTTYVASYHTNVGNYASDSSYFSVSGTDNSPLHAPRSSSVGGNGVYSYSSARIFPNQSFNDTNYWVSPMFVPAGTSSTPTPTVTSTATSTPGTPAATSTPGTSTATSTPGSTATSTPTQIPGTTSIWSTSTTPANIATNDTSAIEVGVKFTADTNGSISGIRFYKGAGNIGKHMGDLWTSTGTLLASATFTGETASGWQQVSFSSPVAVTANTTYVASYHTNVGNYGYNANYFGTSGTNNAPLHAPQSSSVGGNGVYAYSASTTFPNQSFNDTNYWVDVSFISNGTSTPTLTPTPTSTPVPTSTVTPTVTPGQPTSTPTVIQTPTLVPTSTLVPTPTPQTCPCTIWSSLTSPASIATSDTGAIEVGVKFTADTNGWVSGIRFYKGAGNTGVHVGNLWSSTGTLLASATFTGETASGWQQVSFSSPVAVTANTTYVASYHTNVGNYGYNANYFGTSGTNNAPLHAPQSSQVGGNGVYAYSATPAFPNQSYNGTNYWVDVTFSTTQPATPTPVPSPTPQSACPCSLWSNSTTPARIATNDTSAIEVGVKFTADTNGWISGIRFYKGAGNTGVHVGDLWSSTGTLLANATFSNETGSGWQQVSFSSPVAVTANTTYVASYHTNIGNYGYDTSYFANLGTNSPPLHAPQSSLVGGNGVYAYSASSTFPNQSYNDTNYWVDVVFSP